MHIPHSPELAPDQALLADNLESVPAVSVSIRLYSPTKVAIATLLGGILGGCALLWLNYKTLQQERRANQTLLWGIGSFVFLLLLGVFINMQSWGSGLSGGLAAGLYSIAKSTYGDIYKHHAENHGKLGGWWATIGISLIALAVSLIIVISVSVVARLALHR